MALTSTEQIQNAEVTINFEFTGKKNSEGKPIVRLLPYLTVKAKDSAGNEGTTYQMPVDWPSPLQGYDQQPASIVLEFKDSGAFPTGTALHEYKHL